MIGYFTVAHTGTQYFRKHYFGDAGLNWVDLDMLCDDPTRVRVTHCTRGSASRIRAFDGEVITTIRDPLKCLVSWYARGKLAEGPNRYAEWRGAWQCWRDDVRQRASKVLSLESLSSESEVINSITHNSLVHYLFERHDFSELFKLIDRSEVEYVLDLIDAPNEYRWWQ